MAKLHSRIAFLATMASLAMVGYLFTSQWRFADPKPRQMTLKEFVLWSPHFFISRRDGALVFRATGRFEDLARLDPSVDVRHFWVYSKNDRFPSSIRDGKIELLTRIESIETLFLNWSPDVTDASLPQLARLPQLRELGIIETSITDDGWAWLYRVRPDIHAK